MEEDKSSKIFIKITAVFVIEIVKSLVVNLRSWEAGRSTVDEGKVSTGEKSMEVNLLNLVTELQGCFKFFQH